MNFFERWLLRRFDKVSTISEELARRLTRKGIEPPVVLPNWFDSRPSEGQTPLRSQFGIPDRAVLVMFSGTLGAKQGLDLLIDAARLTQSEANIEFVICGEGPLRNELENRAAGLRNLRFLPLQPAEGLLDFLRIADIHVLPQRTAASGSVLPSKLIGMLASGRPIIACANPGTEISHLVRGCGCVTPPGDAVALAGAIRDLAANPQERLELGHAARTQALTHFDRASILPAWERHLLTLRRPTSIVQTGVTPSCTPRS